MECGNCTLCCKLLPVPWMNSPAREYCKKCDINKGCKIYDSLMPEKCKSFNCAYMELENAPKRLRPDKCGIIMERATKDIYFGTIDDTVETLNEPANEFINFLRDRGFSVVLYHPRVEAKIVFQSEGKTSEQVWNEFKEAVK